MGWQLLPPRTRKEREGMGMVPPRIPFRRRETQLKEEHPQQEEWEQIGISAELPESPSIFPLGRSGVQPYIVPPVGRGGIVPTPRVDHRLIGKEQR